MFIQPHFNTNLQLKRNSLLVAVKWGLPCPYPWCYGIFDRLIWCQGEHTWLRTSGLATIWNKGPSSSERMVINNCFFFLIAKPYPMCVYTVKHMPWDHTAMWASLSHTFLCIRLPCGIKPLVKRRYKRGPDSRREASKNNTEAELGQRERSHSFSSVLRSSQIIPVIAHVADLISAAATGVTHTHSIIIFLSKFKQPAS
jgi:hypothetical protein